MPSDGMILPGGVERQEAEFALDILLRASTIQGDAKMMNAVGEVAKVRAEELNNFSPDDVPRFQHPNSIRPGRVNF